MTEPSNAIQQASDTARFERILNVLAEIVRGNYDERIQVDERSDLLLEVEMAINLVLDDLSLSRSQQEEQKRKLAQQHERIAEQQRRLLRLLSTPILKVWPGILALPIIGPVNAERRGAILEAVLRTIADDRAAYVILDLTGVDEPDAETAQFFISAVRTIRLLGAHCMLSGIGPDLSRSLTELETNLHEIPIAARTSDAIAMILSGRIWR